jgi:hypothetical protein
MDHINWPGMDNDELGTWLRELHDILVNEGVRGDDHLDALEEAFTRIEECLDETPLIGAQHHDESR